MYPDDPLKPVFCIALIGQAAGSSTAGLGMWDGLLNGDLHQD
jgi:hypothetical protein